MGNFVYNAPRSFDSKLVILPIWVVLIVYEVSEETLLYKSMAKELLILTESMFPIEKACIINIWQIYHTRQSKIAYK